MKVDRIRIINQQPVDKFKSKAPIMRIPYLIFDVATPQGTDIS